MLIHVHGKWNLSVKWPLDESRYGTADRNRELLRGVVRPRQAADLARSPDVSRDP
jgi:hypothetical protein